MWRIADWSDGMQAMGEWKGCRAWSGKEGEIRQWTVWVWPIVGLVGNGGKSTEREEASVNQERMRLVLVHHAVGRRAPPDRYLAQPDSSILIGSWRGHETRLRGLGIRKDLRRVSRNVRTKFLFLRPLLSSTTLVGPASH